MRRGGGGRGDIDHLNAVAYYQTVCSSLWIDEPRNQAEVLLPESVLQQFHGGKHLKPLHRSHDLHQGKE